MKIFHAIVLALINTGAIAQVSAPIPPRPINLPELSASGAEYLTLTDQLRIRFELLSQFERGGGGSDKTLVSVAAIQAGAQTFTKDVLRRLAPNHHVVSYLLANPAFGASAYVGGIMITQQGLWEQCENSSAFAAVLAHEWVHINNQHISRMLAAQEPSQWMGLLASLAGIATLGQHAQLGQALLYSGSAIPARKFLSFSRDMEEEADREAMALLDRAGFQPQGMVQIMEVLSRYRGVGGESLPFLSTHPLSEERLQAARRRVFDQPTNIKSHQSIASNMRSLSEINLEFDWLRFFITPPERRASQLTLLKQRYGARPWFSSIIETILHPAVLTASQWEGFLSNLHDDLLADLQITPTLFALFSTVFDHPNSSKFASFKVIANYWQAVRTRFPDSSLLAQLHASWQWRQIEGQSQAIKQKIAQSWINEYLAHPLWQTAPDEPSAWNDLLVTWFQTTEQSLGESYFLARSSLIRGNFSIARQHIERAEKIMATLQNDPSPNALIKALPNLPYDLQALKSLLNILQEFTPKPS